MTSLRILVADDLPHFRMVAREWLEAEGHAVETVASGHEAAHALASQRFDLLITDIIMPGGDGIELTRNARKSFPAIKIVAISAGTDRFGPDYYVNLAKKLGADAVLLKPFERGQLREILVGLFPALGKAWSA